MIVIIFTLLLIIFALILNTLTLDDGLLKESFISIISLLVTTLAAIAAAISASAASKSATISENILIQDREKFIDSKRPSFIVLKKEFSLEFDTNILEVVHEINWHDKYKRQTKEYYTKEAFIEIANVGNGFAKDITVTWELNDFEEKVHNYIQSLQKFKYNGVLQHKRYDHINLSFGKYASTENLFLVRYNHEAFSGIDDVKYKNLKAVNYEVADIYPEKIDVQIPLAIVTYINLIFSDRSWAHFLNSLPLIEMKITYKDINDISYEDRFYIYFSNIKHIFSNTNIEIGKFVIQGNKKLL